MRHYKKSNPEKPSVVTTPKNKSKIIDTQEVVIKDAGAKYRKDDGILIPKSFFVIVSGGEKTECLYFKIISNQDRFTRIKIEFIADPKQLNPKGLFEIAKYKREQNELYDPEKQFEPDQIFIVSDVDDFISELLEIKTECESLKIPLIISNSCFEVWLYYANYENIVGFKAPENHLQISKKFRQWMPNNINPTKAILNIKQNIKNAKNHYEIDENGIPKLFSTNMYILAEKILPLIDSELQKLIKENEENSKKHRK